MPFSIHATLHEAGHSMYEYNLPRAFAFKPAGQARGMTVHESQSLSLEMVAGRSLEFLAFLAPLMAEHFGGAAGVWSFANVLNNWRRLDNDYIRVEADEISYPLHVILRYRLEQALLKGDLGVADIPAAWDEMFTRMFGRTPPDLAHGCLQDIHWSAGLFGYFPNYAMGSMLAAQLFERASADSPAILDGLRRRRLHPLLRLGEAARARARQPRRLRHAGRRSHRRTAVGRRLQTARPPPLPRGSRALKHLSHQRCWSCR